MPDVILHGLDGEPLGTLRIPTFERAPRAILYDDEVYVDLTRNRQDYFQVTVYEFPVTGEQVAAWLIREAEAEPAVERVAGQHTSGTGV